MQQQRSGENPERVVDWRQGRGTARRLVSRDEVCR
jgi:hypothetical protein